MPDGREMGLLKLKFWEIGGFGDSSSDYIDVRHTTPGAWEEFSFEAWHAHIRAQLLSSRLNVTDEDFFCSVK